MKYLVELGIDISKENNDEEISLTLAYENEHEALVKYLEENMEQNNVIFIIYIYI